jgi:catechol 2,3-dioxygenase-like lactoylglutathione lyase family enzyme
MAEFITGIQQAGIGVTDAEEAKHLYKEMFGMNVLIFEDKAEATLMTNYTGGELHNRHAILSLNMTGGGGFEIWQFTSRKPSSPVVPVKLGDLGIFAIKIKSKNIKAAHTYFSKFRSVTITDIMIAPDDRPHFWLKDSYGNHFNIVEGDEWFKTGNNICGGVVGAVIGVSNMDKAVNFYKEVLGISEVIYKGTAPMMDAPSEQEAGQVFERVLLKKQVANKGAFSKLLGSVQIELIQTRERKPERIFANRYWGDCGFIHLCFDVLHMDGLKQISAKAGYPFSVDSDNSYSMGTSAGRFCYVEDPDGTLIELVETHKVPILKKLGWYLDLKERKGNKRLPDWMIGMMALNKIR